MKKILIYVVLTLGIFSLNSDVFAKDFQMQELIPIEESATVETENFTYHDFIIQTTAENKGLVKFGNISNRSDKKIPVSINLLLFDESEFNIGYLTYCTEKDLSSNYTDFKLEPNGSAPFTINVVDKYFIDGKSVGDVKYLAVMDENKYCHVGGYDKFQGLKIEQIKEGKVAANMTDKGRALDLFGFLKDKGVMIIIGFISIVLLAFVILGSILNALYKRMFAETTPMAYIPLLSNYVSVKLAFGSIIGKIYLVALFVSVGLYFAGMSIFFLIMNALALLSLLVVIIKLITKKYDLFYFEPAVKNNLSNNVNSGVAASSPSVSDNSFIGSEFTSTPSVKKEETLEDDVVDLSYGNSSINTNFGDSGNSTGISAGKGPLANNDAFVGMYNQNSKDNEQQGSSNNKSEGESDLSKFFK